MKRTMLLWGCAAILLFTACDRRPSDVMDKRQMAEVLTDVHLAESAVAQSEWKSSRAHKQLYGNSVFEKHGITKEDFDRSVEWYALHPEKYVAVYDIVEENLDSLEKDIENYVYHPDEKPTAADSIDTIDIWDKRPSLIYPVKRSADFRAEDLEFYCNLHLACGDHYRLYLLMRAYALDTAVRRMFIAVEKNDSVTDTLSCRVMTDSVLRQPLSDRTSCPVDKGILSSRNQHFLDDHIILFLPSPPYGLPDIYQRETVLGIYEKMAPVLPCDIVKTRYPLVLQELQ